MPSSSGDGHTGPAARPVLARVRQREHERVPARTGAPVSPETASSTFAAAGPKARSERSVRMRSRRSPAALVDGIRPIGSTVVTSARPGDAWRPSRNHAPSGAPTWRRRRPAWAPPLARRSNRFTEKSGPGRRDRTGHLGPQPGGSRRGAPDGRVEHDRAARLDPHRAGARGRPARFGDPVRQRDEARWSGAVAHAASPRRAGRRRGHRRSGRPSWRRRPSTTRAPS